MRDYRSSCIPDLEKCSVLQALMWWQFRQQPVSVRIEAKLNRTPSVNSQQWTLEDTYAFFELCKERVAFWGKPAKNITTEYCGSEFNFYCTDCGELEQIPHIRLMGSIVTGDNLYSSLPLFHREHFDKNPSEFWAYLFVEVDVKELKELFPPAVPEAAPAIAASAVTPLPSPPDPVKIRRGSYAVADAPLIARGVAGVKDGSWNSPYAAGLALAPEARGGGNEESKAKRLAAPIKRQTENG